VATADAPAIPGGLNAAEALQRATEGAHLARAAGFEVEPRSELAALTWEGILNVAGEVDVTSS
jgi:hypothetical protein